jgi:hypothetical protein
MSSPYNQQNPLISSSNSGIRVTRWSDFIDLRTPPQLVRIHYATQELEYSAYEACRFADSKDIPGETLAKIKLWHYSFHSKSEVPEITNYLATICTQNKAEQFDASVDRIKELLTTNGLDYSQLLHASMNLTLGDMPIAGLIIGSAMKECRHPKDGEALIRLALNNFEKKHPSAQEHSQKIAEFREKFPLSAI